MCSEGLIERYVNFYTDFAFKKFFGTAANKDLLISFLNALLKLEGENVITDLTYLNAEQLGSTHEDRRAIYDVYCTNQKDERFIVEMQRAEQQFFKDRSLYYCTFPIQDEAKIGEENAKLDELKRARWNYKLHPIYVVGILDFKLKDNKKDRIVTTVKLKDDDNDVFNNNLAFIYVEMPKFCKQENELEDMLDKWIYAMKNLYMFRNRPEVLNERIFKRLFEIAEIANYSRAELNEYRDSLKYFRDYANTIDFAEKKGEHKQQLSIARNMLDKGMDIDLVSELTELSVDEIKNL